MEVFMIGVDGYYEGRNIPATEAAESRGINPRSLFQGFQSLHQAGLIDSQTGGVNPGYKLSRDPKTITLFEVLDALEYFPRIKCVHETKDGGDCMVCGTINRAMDSMESEYKSVTLYDYYLSLY